MRNDTKLDVLWEEVEELKKSGGGGSDLPDVTEADNGKILGVVNGEWNTMDAPAGGVNYSTTEQDTGRKWVDGKNVYSKTFIIENPTAGNDISIPHGIENLDVVCNFDGFAVLSSSSSYKNNTTSAYLVDLHEVTRSNSMWNIGTSIVSQISYLVMVLYYTKTNPTKKKTTKK